MAHVILGIGVDAVDDGVEEISEPDVGEPALRLGRTRREHDQVLPASRRDSGEPHLNVTGRAAVLASDRGIATWHLSITHTDQVAIAYVIAS